MPAARKWTPAEEALIVAMASDNKSTADIGLAIGCSPTTARWKAISLGVDRFDHRRQLPPEFRVETPIREPEREPLPAGHPTSWGAIVAGTCIEGEYPR